jgi:hypothetical protein
VGLKAVHAAFKTQVMIDYVQMYRDYVHGMNNRLDSTIEFGRQT